MPKNFDAIVIGAGPNGLAAAITLLRSGLSVVLYEANPIAGGGMRSAEITLPGYVHDLCSAIHPFALTSPFFESLDFSKLGLQLIHPPAPLAHPLADGSAVMMEKSLDATAKQLTDDGEAFKKLFFPFARHWDKLKQDVLGPLHIPRHPFLLARFARIALRSAEHVWKTYFREKKGQALFAGLAGHSILSLDCPMSAAFGLVLGTLGVTSGWPIVKGGSQKIADALLAYFLSLGGEIHLATTIHNIDYLPPVKIILCDLSPQQLLAIAGHRLSESYRRKLQKFRYGPGIFKLDWALSQPIPWKAKECLRAATVHVGNTAEEIALSEREIFENKHPEKPFIILAQQSLFDTTRTPDGKQTAWAYCHVPNGSSFDMTERIENQIERFAPGFKDCILAKKGKSARDVAESHPNYVGGDINSGLLDFSQFFARPAGLFNPYATPEKGLFLCSSSTPPGGGVHGMCGYHAARAALRSIR